MPSLSGLRLLVVEDDALVAEDIRAMLAGLGIAVVGPVGDVGAATVLARIAAIDGGLLDVAVGGQGVYPVIDALDARGLPAVLATGYDGAALPRSAQGLPRLRKPFGAAKLERLLAAVFATPDRRRDRA